MSKRPLLWVGSARQDLRAFPRPARRLAGHQLDRLQKGLDPVDFKAMPSVGPGVYEIRVRAQGAFRIFYVAKFKEGIYVLHAFEKKSQRTSRRDLELGAARYQELVRQRQLR
ncbi:MAG: type II toxin-antitoxin system RelE/ParE family toxin [Gemmatimonadota bacterium]